MLVAGIRRIGGDVGMIGVPGPRPLTGDEVLIQVRAAGVGNWDAFVRTGGWGVGRRPVGWVGPPRWWGWGPPSADGARGRGRRAGHGGGEHGHRLGRRR